MKIKICLILLLVFIFSSNVHSINNLLWPKEIIIPVEIVKSQKLPLNDGKLLTVEMIAVEDKQAADILKIGPDEWFKFSNSMRKELKKYNNKFLHFETFTDGERVKSLTIQELKNVRQVIIFANFHNNTKYEIGQNGDQCIIINLKAGVYSYGKIELDFNKMVLKKDDDWHINYYPTN